MKPFLSVLFIIGVCSGLQNDNSNNTKTSSNEVDIIHLLNEESFLRLQLEQQFLALQNTVHSLQTQMNHQQATITALQSAQRQQTIAFLATLSRDIIHPARGHIIVFDKETLNIGNAYNSNTGIFTAPVKGTYLFTVSVTSDVADNHMDLKQSGRVVAYLFSDKNEPQKNGHGSITVILHLSKGDRVWVSERKNSQTIIRSTYMGQTVPQNIFSGHLIQKDS